MAQSYKTFSIFQRFLSKFKQNALKCYEKGRWDTKKRCHPLVKEPLNSHFRPTLLSFESIIELYRVMAHSDWGHIENPWHFCLKPLAVLPETLGSFA